MHLTALALHAIAATANAHSWAARIDAKDAPAIRAALDGGQPFVAANALDGNARGVDGRVRCGRSATCLARSRSRATPSKRRSRSSSTAAASSHAEPHFLFDEALLDGDLRDAAIAPQRAIFEGEESWLDAFPAERRPADACVVCAGAGARSPLHRDPYDWTGTSLCLEGSKVWRFLLDVDEADLEAYKLPSEAFGDDSAGTQSDIDLYCVREGDWPHAAEFENRDLVKAKAGPENFTPSAQYGGASARACRARGGCAAIVAPDLRPRAVVRRRVPFRAPRRATARAVSVIGPADDGVFDRTAPLGTRFVRCLRASILPIASYVMHSIFGAIRAMTRVHRFFIALKAQNTPYATRRRA